MVKSVKISHISVVFVGLHVDHLKEILIQPKQVLLRSELDICRREIGEDFAFE